MKLPYNLLSFYASLLMLMNTNLIAQSWEGIYKGELINSENAISIATLGSNFYGTLYLSADDKKIFNGKIDGSVLRGTIKLSGQAYILMAEWRNDSIPAIRVEISKTVKDSSFVVYSGNMIKVSTDPQAKVSEFLKHQSSVRDPALMGAWTLVKQLDLQDKEMPVTRWIEYYDANGDYRFEATPEMERTKEKGRRDLAKQGYTPPRATWETIGNKIVLGRFSSTDYYISNDTLVKRLPDKGFTMFLKKKK